jgi:hypothetical protein
MRPARSRPAGWARQVLSGLPALAPLQVADGSGQVGRTCLLSLVEAVGAAERVRCFRIVLPASCPWSGSVFGMDIQKTADGRAYRPYIKPALPRGFESTADQVRNEVVDTMLPCDSGFDEPDLAVFDVVPQIAGHMSVHMDFEAPACPVFSDLQFPVLGVHRKTAGKQHALLVSRS